MTPVSKRKVEIKVSKFLEKTSKGIFVNLKPSEIQSVFSIMFTKTEQEMLKKRLGIILLLYQDLTVTEIADLTKTTLQTVERIKLQLQLIASKDKQILVKKLKRELFKQDLVSILKDIGSLDISRSGFRKRLSKIAHG